MREISLPSWRSSLAAAITLAVFSLDIFSQLEAAVSVLYIIAIVVGATGRSARIIKFWTGLCISLALAAFGMTHIQQINGNALLRLVVSVVGMGVTSALLCLMERERRARQEVRHLNEALQELVRKRTDELSRSEHRFSAFFSDLDIPCAECDIAEARRILDRANARCHAIFDEMKLAEPALVEQSLQSLRLTKANGPLLTLIGCTDEEAFVNLPLDAWIEEAAKLRGSLLETIFYGRRRLAQNVTIIERMERRIPASITLNILPDGTSCFATVIDNSEQQRVHEAILKAEMEMARANRAATLGALTSSLIHELNQPILAVGLEIGNVRRALAREPVDLVRTEKAIMRMERNATRVSAIVQRFREQLTKRKRRITAVSLCALLADTYGLLERELGSRATSLTWRCDDEDMLVLGDWIEIQQVVINLVMNAAEAMSEVRGAREICIDASRIGENFVQMAVADSGPGIPESNLSRIFEPFFTTKPGGMGMGLQICRSITESFGGKLRAESSSDGCTFIMTLMSVASEAQVTAEVQ